MKDKKKHYVFSARTTQEGLKVLNDLKSKLGVSWDELVIDAVCGHYELDKTVMALPRAEEKKLAAVSDNQKTVDITPAHEAGAEKAKANAAPRRKHKKKKADSKAAGTVS